jgi:Integral peroxisomal membrane peroxin
MMFALLIPSYQARHPPPPSAISNVPAEVTQAISPAPQPAKPAPELSRDFLMNMRDIQNTMDDFSNAYDLVRAWVVHVTTFRNEPLSSTVLAFTFMASIVMVMFIQFIPLRWIVLVLGNAAILACNPVLYKYIMTKYITPEEIERIKRRVDQFVKDDYIPPPPSKFVTFTVEIFESRRLLPPVPPKHFPDWSTSKFSHFPPQSTSSTEKLSAISPPSGYVFGEDEWKVDDNTQKWATERGVNNETGFWVPEGDEFDREGDGWVVYEAGGWKVRRLTRGVVRAVI